MYSTHQGYWGCWLRWGWYVSRSRPEHKFDFLVFSGHWLFLDAHGIHLLPHATGRSWAWGRDIRMAYLCISFTCYWQCVMMTRRYKGGGVSTLPRSSAISDPLSGGGSANNISIEFHQNHWRNQLSTACISLFLEEAWTSWRSSWRSSWTSTWVQSPISSPTQWVVEGLQITFL